MSPLAQVTLVVVLIIGPIFIMILWLLLLPVIYDYRILSDQVRLIFLGIPIISLHAKNIVDVRIVSLTSLFSPWKYNPFRTLRIGNRFSRECVLIKRRGIIRYVILTPKNTLEFYSSLKEIVSDQAHARNDRTWKR